MVEKEIELRPYQREAIAAFLASDGHATLQMAPGSGKTLCACGIIKAVHAVKPLIVVPTLVLRDQYEKVLAREGIVAEIVTYAWAAQHVDDEEFWAQFDIIVWDEVHHLGYGEVFMRLLVRAHPDNVRYSLGLSATPPLPVDGEENIAMRVMPIVYTYTFAQGREQGFTADIEIRPVEVQLSPEERAKYKELTDKIKEMIARYGSDNYQNKPYGKDPETGKTIWGASLTNARRQLLSLAEAKYEKLVEIVARVLAEGHTRIWVWSDYVESLKKAKEVLNRDAPISELITGETPKLERYQIMNERWGRDFQVLLVAKVGDEGIDSKASDIGIVLLGSRTTRQAIQRAGRLLRPDLTQQKKANLFILFATKTTDERLVGLFDMLME